MLPVRSSGTNFGNIWKHLEMALHLSCFWQGVLFLRSIPGQSPFYYCVGACSFACQAAFFSIAWIQVCFSIDPFRDKRNLFRSAMGLEAGKTPNIE